jgi:D-glycero-D-manno-heptose 1,7-bisphosphate phosphatase
MSREKVAIGNNTNAAVFLDRDGTIIEDRGYLSDVSQIVFFPETIESLRRLQKYFLLFMVTNQPGIARGIISREDVNHINSATAEKMTEAGIEIADIYVCPHDRSDNCECIKPNPYFLQKAARDYNINLQRSFVVGDHPCDVHLAKNTGARGIYVLTGHGSKHVADLPQDAEIVSGIEEAAERIISCHRDTKV